jgi:hemolysin activation/secretion protein
MHFFLDLRFSLARCTAVIVLCTSAGITYAHEDVLLTAAFISGSTRYTTTDLAPAFAARIGQRVDRALLDAIARDIQSQYHRDGHLSPAVIALDSELHTSTPRIHVFEAALGEIAIRGEPGPYVESIMREGRSLQRGMLDRERIQSYIRRLNDFPGLSVRARFEPSDLAPARMRLVLDTRYVAGHFNAAAANRGTDGLGRTLVSARGTLNGVLGTRSAVSLFAGTSSELDPYRSAGLSLVNSFGSTRVRTDAMDTQIRLDDYEYEARRVRTELKTTLFESEGFAMQPFIGFAWRDARGREAGVEVSDVRTRVAQAGLIGSGNAERTSASMRIGFSRGLDAFGASAETTYGPAPSVAFSKLTMDGSVQQRIGAPWLLRIDIEGQWSDDDLPGSELWAFGGAVYGRAFDPAELVGISGGAISVEMNRALPWQLLGAGRTSVYMQGDYGVARERDRSHADAASISVGLRAAVRGVSTALELGLPVERTRENAGSTRPRAFMQVQIRY